MISGESRPVKKQTGATVIASTVNGAGALRVEVTGTGERSVCNNVPVSAEVFLPGRTQIKTTH
jgi:Cu2+-exporting ATPase